MPDMGESGKVFRLTSGLWQSGVCNSLHQLQQNGILCDVILNIADSQQIVAHSCVMAAASPYLREIIVAKRNDAHLDRLHSEALHALIAYMYSGELEFAKELLPEILKAAHMLQMRTLIEELARYQHCFLQNPDRLFSVRGYITQPDIGSTLSLLSHTPNGLVMANELHKYHPQDSTDSNSDSEDESSTPNASPSIPCEACGKMFKQKGALGMHMKGHFLEILNDTQDVIAVKCKGCKNNMKNKARFLAHIKICPRKDVFRQDRENERDQPFHCPFCNNNFEQKGAFGSHMNTHVVEIFDKHHVRVSMRCKLCEQTFAEKNHFMSHINSCSGRKVKNVIRCKFASCSHTFQSRSTMLKHHALHHGQRAQTMFKSSTAIEKEKQAGKTPPKTTSQFMAYKCAKCRKLFTTQAEWMKHKLSKHSFHCATCGKKFSSRSSFAVHLDAEGHVAGKNSLGMSLNTSPSKSPDTKANVEIKCKFCNKSFVSETAVTKHKAYCVRVRSDKVSEDTSVSRCKFCGKDYPSEVSVTKHMAYCVRIRGTEDQIAAKVGCKTCKKVFTSYKALSSHLYYCEAKNASTSTPKVENPDSSSESSDSSDSDVPLTKKIIHQTPKEKETNKPKEVVKVEARETFTCELCGINISNNALYLSHKVMCAERGFKCAVCGEKSKSLEKFIEHKSRNKECVSINDQFVEEVHGCGACRQSFSSPMRVTMHANKCHKSTADNEKALAMYKKDLRECQVCRLLLKKNDEPYYHHMWIKHGVKSRQNAAYYKCDICHERYIYPREFEAHEATHPENHMKHTCKICDIRFRRKLLLEKHMSEKHE